MVGALKAVGKPDLYSQGEDQPSDNLSQCLRSIDAHESQRLVRRSSEQGVTGRATVPSPPAQAVQHRSTATLAP